MENTQNTNIEIIPSDKSVVRQLVKVAVILGIITGLEFAIAFLFPHDWHTMRVMIFVGMTIVKAGYIVGEFMHLAHESKVLIWSILLPLIFIVWLITALIFEGGTMVTNHVI